MMGQEMWGQIPILAVSPEDINLIPVYVLNSVLH